MKVAMNCSISSFTYALSSEQCEQLKDIYLSEYPQYEEHTVFELTQYVTFRTCQGVCEWYENHKGINDVRVLDIPDNATDLFFELMCNGIERLVYVVDGKVYYNGLRPSAAESECVC